GCERRSGSAGSGQELRATRREHDRRRHVAIRSRRQAPGAVQGGSSFPSTRRHPVESNECGGDRVRLILTLTSASVLLALLVAPLAAEAQQAGKVARVGILFLGSPSTPSPRTELVREELRRLGYVEGQTIVYEIRSAAGRLDRVRPLANELVRARVDVIVTGGST